MKCWDSINSPDRPVDKLPRDEAAEAATTYYIKGGNRLAALFTILATLLTHPAVLGRGIAALLELRGLTLRQRGKWLLYFAEAVLVGRWMQERKLDHLHVHFGRWPGRFHTRSPSTGRKSC